MSVAVDEDLEALGRSIVANSLGAIASAQVAFGELTLHAETHRIVQALTLLRDHSEYRFVQLVDLCGVDYPDRAQRFDVVYHLLSLSKNRRIRVKVKTDEDTPVPSIVPVYPAADWFEREAFDMYGIFFDEPPGPPPHPHRLRLPRLSAEEGFPHDRIRGGALGRSAEARDLRAGEAERPNTAASISSPLGKAPAMRYRGRGPPTFCRAMRRRSPPLRRRSDGPDHRHHG